MASSASDYTDRFGGVGRVLGDSGLEILRTSCVMVIGLGGVGSWTAEALARTGIGKLILVDLDDVCVTNVNRQVLALSDTVGRNKAVVMAERIRVIAPEIDVQAVEDFYTPSNADTLLECDVDIVIDTIDAYRDKLDLVRRTRAKRIPLVVVGSAGGRLDPSKIQSTDLNRTEGDGMLRRLRRELRGTYDFPRDRRWKIPTIYSNEQRRFPDDDGGTSFQAVSGGAMDCSTGIGSLTWVTGTMGFWAASAAVDRLLAHLPPPR